jgi:prepilin-type N-terminal cleavage/methylation domain-containing protein
MIPSRASHRGFSLVELLFVLAIGATLMAVGTPILRGALGEQRLRTGATNVGNALAEARREAVRTSETARVDVDPATGRISVFSRDVTTNGWVERRRFHLPRGVAFVGLLTPVSFAFDTLGRPAALPMTVQLRLVQTGVVRSVTVLGSGRVNIT